MNIPVLPSDVVSGAEPLGEQRSSSLAGHPRDEALATWLGATPAAAGIRVNEQTAMQFSAVFRAVELISSSVAMLPIHLYRHGENDQRERIRSPLSRLLNFQPNPEMDAFAFRQAMQAHVLTWGNGYAEIERANDGSPLSLWLLPPHRVSPQRTVEGSLYYETPFGPIPSDDMLHLAGLGYDGVVGYSVIRMAKEAVAMGLATERYGAKFFGGGSRPGGVLETPKRLSDAGMRNLRESWERLHGGPDNAHRTAILEEGMQWKQVGIPPEDAQFLETRKFQVNEIARWYGLPPHMLGDLDRATFSNIEHQSLEYLTYTLGPWLRRWELRCALKLLRPIEHDTHYFEHLPDALMRTDINSRYTAYSVGRNNGWLSVNDIRKRENLEPVAGGDAYLMPLNMTPVGKSDDQTRPAVEPPAVIPMAGSSQDQATTIKLARCLAEDALGRLARRASQAVERIGAKMTPAWQEEFLVGERRAAETILDAVARGFSAIRERLPADVWRAWIVGNYLDGLRGMLDDPSQAKEFERVAPSKLADQWLAKLSEGTS